MRGLLVIGLLAAATMSLSHPDGTDRSDVSDPFDVSDRSDVSDCGTCERFVPSRDPVTRPVPPAPVRSPDDDDFRPHVPPADPDLDRPPHPPASDPGRPRDDPYPPAGQQSVGPVVDARPGHGDLGGRTDLVAHPPATRTPPTGHWETRRAGMFGLRTVRVWVRHTCGPDGCR